MGRRGKLSKEQMSCSLPAFIFLGGRSFSSFHHEEEETYSRKFYSNSEIRERKGAHEVYSEQDREAAQVWIPLRFHLFFLENL